MLPQFGFSEFLLIAIVALIVVGPRDLPVMLRRLGQFVAKGRRMANEFRAAFDDIARQTELDELRKEIQDLKKNADITKAADDLKAYEQDVNSSIMAKDAARPAKAGPARAPEIDTARDAAE